MEVSAEPKGKEEPPKDLAKDRVISGQQRRAEEELKQPLRDSEVIDNVTELPQSWEEHIDSAVDELQSVGEEKAAENREGTNKAILKSPKLLDFEKILSVLSKEQTDFHQQAIAKTVIIYLAQGKNEETATMKTNDEQRGKKSQKY